MAAEADLILSFGIDEKFCKSLQDYHVIYGLLQSSWTKADDQLISKVLYTTDICLRTAYIQDVTTFYGFLLDQLLNRSSHAPEIFSMLAALFSHPEAKAQVDWSAFQPLFGIYEHDSSSRPYLDVIRSNMN